MIAGHGDVRHGRFGDLPAPRVLHAAVPHLGPLRITGCDDALGDGGDGREQVLVLRRVRPWSGLLIHMMTGAMFGIGFAFLARRLPRTALVPAGAMYGLAVFVVSAFIGLPVAAKITSSGTTISDMASMVGWATFAVEHMMFGLVLGASAVRTAPADNSTAAVRGARSAMLSR